MSDSNKLTALRVAQEKRPGRYADGGGLYLRVSEYPCQDGTLAHSKGWVFRYQRGGRERMMGLGSLNTLSLVEARVAARQCRIRVEYPKHNTIHNIGRHPLRELRRLQKAAEVGTGKHSKINPLRCN
jgi:hypothetical protein